jgi:hypothetical protein
MSHQHNGRLREKWEAYFPPPLSPQESLQTTIDQLGRALTYLEGPRAAEQHRIIQRLIDRLEIDLAPFQGCAPDPEDTTLVLREDGSPLDAEERKKFRQASAAYEKAILKTIRAIVKDARDLDCRLHLHWIPPIVDWITTWRGLGARDLLRRAKCGLERGVRRPLRPPSETLNPCFDSTLVIAEYQRLKRQRLGGKLLSFRSIHRILAKRGIIPNRHGQPMTWQALDKHLRRWGVR